MNRDIQQTLVNWKAQSDRMPILLRGARQVGKSYVAEQFGCQHFDSLVTINFELQPECIACFDTLQPSEILQKLTLTTRQKITPGETLLFLDEIQDCPNAIRALRYFKEKLPMLHVIAAGSLLEFTLNDAEFRMPVGRVQSLYLKPLSFKEYLTAANDQASREFIEQINLKKPIPEAIHQALLKQVKTYMGLGGMPSVLSKYFNETAVKYDVEFWRKQQAILLNTYRQDFGKYAKHSQIQYLQLLFEKAPGLVGTHFKYAKVDPDIRSQYIKSALTLLTYAGLIYPVYSTSASGVPLMSLINEKKFKILFLDVGLVVYASRLEEALLSSDVVLVNRGELAEQFVGQELLAYAPNYDEAKAFFWCREKKSSMAEVDFIMTAGGHIIPIEVTAGATGQLKSLHLLMKEKNMKIGVRVSQKNLQFDGKILSVPIYMVGEIERLVKMFL